LIEHGDHLWSNVSNFDNSVKRFRTFRARLFWSQEARMTGNCRPNGPTGRGCQAAKKAQEAQKEKRRGKALRKFW
jgi:hypothetical protein